MPPAEQFEILVVGSGKDGRLLARDMAQSRRRTAVVERQWIGGACHTVACLPSKNEIWNARVAHFVRNAAQFGLTTGPVAVDMAEVRQHKRAKIDRIKMADRDGYEASGAELIMGSGQFVAPKTVEVRLNDGGRPISRARLIAGGRASDKHHPRSLRSRIRISERADAKKSNTGWKERTMLLRTLSRLDFGHVVAILIVAIGMLPFVSAGLSLQP